LLIFFSLHSNTHTYIILNTLNDINDIMGKTGYTKCVELIQKLSNEGKKILTMEELKIYIAKEIGFSIAHDTVNNYFNALILFNLIKKENDKYIIVEEELNDK